MEKKCAKCKLYKNESEFNKKLDEEIQRIKDIKEEYELEKKNG